MTTAKPKNQVQMQASPIWSFAPTLLVAAGLSVASALYAQDAAPRRGLPPATPVTAADIAKLDGFVGDWNRARNPPPELAPDPKTPKLDDVATAHLQPWAKLRQQTTEWDVDDTGAICKRNGIFRQGIGTQFPMVIVRSLDKLAFIGDTELEEVGPRDIFMNSPHPDNLTPTWDGDSRGHFEGDTLIVDTIGFNDRSWLYSDRIPHTEDLHVIEYLQLHDGGKYLTDRVFVDDRRALTSPYTFYRVYERQPVDPVSGLPVRMGPPGGGGRNQAAGAAPAAGPAPAGSTARAGGGGGGINFGGDGGDSVCNQSLIGHDPWRRQREAILKEHQEQLDSFIQQTLTSGTNYRQSRFVRSSIP